MAVSGLVDSGEKFGECHYFSIVRSQKHENDEEVDEFYAEASPPTKNVHLDRSASEYLSISSSEQDRKMFREAVSIWMSQFLSMNQTLRGDILQQKANLNNLRSYVKSGEAASAPDIDKLNEYRTTIAEKLSEYDLQDIYNCDKTGEDKLKPLFIHKYKNPQPLRGISIKDSIGIRLHGCNSQFDDEIVETLRLNPNADDLQDEEEIIPVIFLTEALLI
ncbi:18902_t:CDS:2 [Funneliformis geosporum]|nr:18902_t:CDS:2 [Funneliformis geosporum]